jgi:outer membrane protein OmpA-like peptidoglycan-associated protein
MSIGKIAVLTVALLIAVPAQASSLFTYQIKNQLCLKGRDKPAVVVEALEDFKSIQIQLTRSDGKELTLGPRAMREGQTYEFGFSQDDGEFDYEGAIVGTYANDESYEVPIYFSVFVGGNLDMEVPRDQIDLGSEVLTILLTRPAGRAEVEVIGLDGVLAQQEYELSGEPAGTPINLEWNAPRGEVLKLMVRGYDKWGFYVQEDITPWSLEIPHDDVHFASGSHVIEETEKPKLDKAFATIMEKVEQYGEIVEIKLFIGGYTDTVDSRSYNQSLSERRARAIAGYFRERGFRAPIRYQGFGEDALALETNDEVDEIKNRRAVYVLAAWPPARGKNFPRAAWKNL